MSKKQWSLCLSHFTRLIFCNKLNHFCWRSKISGHNKLASFQSIYRMTCSSFDSFLSHNNSEDLSWKRKSRYTYKLSENEQSKWMTFRYLALLLSNGDISVFIFIIFPVFVLSIELTTDNVYNFWFDICSSWLVLLYNYHDINNKHLNLIWILPKKNFDTNFLVSMLCVPLIYSLWMYWNRIEYHFIFIAYPTD